MPGGAFGASGRVSKEVLVPPPPPEESLRGDDDDDDNDGVDEVLVGFSDENIWKE